MNPALRDARLDEIAALEALQRRASSSDAAVLPPDHVRDGRTRVAVDAGDRPLGFAVLLQRDDGSAVLDGLFTDPPHMRRGIGSRLLHDAADRARARGAPRLDVIANPDAVSFYRRHGFADAGQAQTRFGPAPRLSLAL